MNIIYTMFWKVVHSFTGCPDKDLESVYKNKECRCKKCGSIYMMWEQ